MKTANTCPKCNGTGEEIYHICDICKSRDTVAVIDDGAELCQECWAKTLTDEEIQNL